MELMEAATTTTGKGNTVKNESNIDGNSSNNRSNNKRLKLSLPLSPMLGSLPPSPLSPLFTAINNSNSISSNNSKGSNTNGNSTGIPFTTSSWWKNGSRASSISESLSKSQDGINSSSRRHREDKTTSSTAMNTYAAAAAATARTVSSPSSLLPSSSKTKCVVDTTVATAKDMYQNGEDSLATATGSLDPYFLKSSSSNNNNNNNNNAVASALAVIPTNATTVETASIIAASILSSIPQYAATNRLQNYQQQRLNVQLDQQGMHQHQQQHLHRHYQHPYQYHQQQQQLFQSSASSGDDVYVQRIKQPAPTPIVRMETNNNIIDILRSSPSMRGEDIISSSTNIAELPPSPDVERELQESYQEDASFDDENEENVEKLRQTNKSDNDNGNTNNNNRYNNPVTNVDNDDDLAFSDIEEIVPDIVKSITATPTSGSYQPPPADAQPLLPPPVFDGVHIELNDDDDDDVADDDDDDDDCNNRINDRNQIIPHAVMSSSSFNINTDNNNNNDDYDNDIGQFSPYYSPLTETANIVAGVDADEDVYADADADVDVDAISSDDNQTKEVKFRVYQAENWTEKFEDLLHFREINGHCLVPNKHPENPALAQWIKRQRYQYKLKIEGKRSTITDQRVTALEDAGFVWDSHKAVWAERLEELNDFQEQFGHCNVPSRYEGNHQLAIWVKRQRRQRKNKIDSLPNCMTDERQQKLEELGFVWDMKKQKRA